ncbi:MAG: hypothetical protein H5T59_06180 [Anaerolineae bacterium]|nr:hypothetical protein [Anaerolineae bacterium]
MDIRATRRLVEQAIARGDGILRLEPAWVAREVAPPGYRLGRIGLPDDQVDAGERGAITERWLASVTKAHNRIGPPDEGLSYLQGEGPERITLKEAVDAAADLILGAEYAATHRGLGRLFKVFDYGTRLPFHLHHREEHARLVGRGSKEEAYYFPEGVDMGPHPETFFGVHPSLAQEGHREALLPYLEAWDSDLILRCSRAYLQVPGEGFLVPPGVPHAPGTAVTLELQEDADIGAVLQAKVGGRLLPKDVLYKAVRPEDRERYGERFILQLATRTTTSTTAWFPSWRRSRKAARSTGSSTARPASAASGWTCARAAPTRAATGASTASSCGRAGAATAATRWRPAIPTAMSSSSSTSGPPSP